MWKLVATLVCGFLLVSVPNFARGQAMSIDAYKGTFSPPSLFSVRLHMFAEGKEVFTGTGFLYLPKGSKTPYLVSNYHVLTGAKPQTPGVLIEGINVRPDQILFQSLSKKDLRLVTSNVDLNTTKILEHPRRSDGVDLAAVPVTPNENALILNQDELGLVEDIELTVGGELFILGFPFGVGADANLPIWKRGTIASEPNLLLNGLRMFYIDATTKPGMSGSPVFTTEDRTLYTIGGDAARAFEKWERGEGSASDAITLIDAEKMETVKQRALRLVGVYSGRLEPDGRDTQIGVVWRRSLLEELFITIQK